MKYEAKIFTLPEVPGVSAKQIEEHVKLYQGYVKHVNLIDDELKELGADAAKNGHLTQELRRRLGFEFNGMRLHEYYFGDLEGGPKALPASPLWNLLIAEYGSVDAWKESFKKIVARGSGWALLNYDPIAKCLHMNWVTNHDEGQLATLPVVVALDVWEHAYMVDYLPGDKMKYVDAYLAALNMETIAARFEKIA